MYDLVANNEINISPAEWKRLNAKYSQDEIKQMISDAIGDNDLPMPMRSLTISDAVEDFKKLEDLDASSLLVEEEWFTRYDYKDKYFFKNKLIKCCNNGNKTSDFYQQENRWKCNSITAPSGYRSWTIEKFRLTMLNALWSLKFQEINSKTLRTAISMRKYIASQFRPSAAKTIYDFFNGKNILDFSAGWGDRLCGFLATDAESYVGVDPNSDAVSKYCDMIDSFGVERDVTIYNECAEDVDYGDKKFDLVFTSPPYFDLERYTTEDNQSWRRYKKLDVWLEGFLFKSIENAWNHLDKNGYLIINISDVYCHHVVTKICDPMNDFISSLSNSSYIGCWGYEMRKRPNSKSLKGKNGKFAEPVWIWRKI